LKSPPKDIKKYIEDKPIQKEESKRKVVTSTPDKKT